MKMPGKAATFPRRMPSSNISTSRQHATLLPGGKPENLSGKFGGTVGSQHSSRSRQEKRSENEFRDIFKNITHTHGRASA